MSFCGHCGTRANEGQTFCQSCGQALAGPPAGTAPSAAATLPPEYLSPAPTRLPRSSPARRPSAKVIGGIAGTVLALGIGGVAAVQLVGGSGGADNPEQAVTELAAAISAQDPLAIADLLNPHETEGLDEVVGALRERLADEDLTSKEGRLTEAASLQIDNLDLSTSKVGEGIAKVRVNGAGVTAAYDPSEVPASLVPDNGVGEADSWSGDIATEYEESTGFAISLTTVEVDGRWYVSPLATMLDLQVDNYRLWYDGLSSPDYDAYATTDEVEPVVGESVQEAVANTVNAATSQSLDDLMATLPAGQAAVLRPYLPVLQSVLRTEGASFEVTLDEIEGEESDEGDLRRLVIDRANVSAYGSEDDDGGSAVAYLEGSCVGYQSDYDEESTCLDGEFRSWTGISEPSILARKVDGGWQVDPVATAVDYLSQAVEGGDVTRVTQALREEW